MPIDLDQLDRMHEAGQPVDTARLRNSQQRAIDHMTRKWDGPAAPKKFIDARPRADRYVYVLLRDLTKINADAGRAGREWYDRNREELTVEQGSDWINRLKAKIAEGPRASSVTVEEPRPNPARGAWAEWRALAAELVEFGGPTGARFAVDTEDGSTNTVAFWWIVRHEGHDGMVKYFIRQVIGGQGPVRVRMSPEAMITIARKIKEAGPRDAMLRFGREIGSCGHCGRVLTNDESRRAGIGPVCLKKKGW